ncbi:helix-turn-helix domain-containing protein [Rhodococcus pyridinivorans]|uniref:helix-turn-helix domain-containing protein n=1 Tax=Rhodococcus pyridinivorans TaxID=103816 RepID=UPI002078E8D9|nr:helix-turn-helix domain-containing protein [Rhodococcus pyridinivorans]USI93011.1 helix-turn-helix domain-containing protein [Rhodococcus pyridinivorans]
MTGTETDPKNNPEYLTLSQASKECGVSVPVLQELVRARKIMSGLLGRRTATPICTGTMCRVGRKSKTS